MSISPQPVANKRTIYLLSDVTGVVTRLLVWLFVSLACPLSVTATALSFKIEVLECSLPGALPPGAQLHVTLAERVLHRLEAAEKHEPDAWLRDDIRIAWITVLEASRGNRQAHVDATYRVLGLHPDKVWPAIIERHLAILGEKFALIDADAPSTSQRASKQVGELSAKCAPCKPSSERRAASVLAGRSGVVAAGLSAPVTNSLDLPQTKKQPMAESRDGDAPQKTCAYGAQESKLAGQKRRDLTGTSCSTETKREARRTLTSEFGLNDAPPAGVAAPAEKSRTKKKAA